MLRGNVIGSSEMDKEVGRLRMDVRCRRSDILTNVRCREGGVVGLSVMAAEGILTGWMGRGWLVKHVKGSGI